MPLSDKQKYEIIIRHEQGQPIRRIAEEMDLNKCTVNLWIIRYRDTGNIDRKIGSGRKKKTTKKQDQMIIYELKKNKYLTAKNVKKIVKHQNVDVCVRTIINRFNEN